MLGQRRRRWASNKPALGLGLVIAGEAFNQYWFDVRPASQKLGQDQAMCTISSMRQNGCTTVYMLSVEV